MTRLVELAKVLRSKNAGPLYLTLDIMFDEKEVYDKVIRAGVLNKKLISELYHVGAEDVSVISYPAAYSIKVTLPRKIISGDTGDMDIYGAQQHAPLMDVEID